MRTASSTNDVFARRFSSAGGALTSEFQVNSHTVLYLVYPALAANRDGDFVVAWQGVTQDGLGVGIFARRVFEHRSAADRRVSAQLFHH